MTGSNHEEHIQDVRLVWDAEEASAKGLVVTIGLELLSRTVLRTPVDKGPLRANWQMTLSSPATGTIDAEDPSGSAAIERGTSAVSPYSLGQDIWLTNNLVYASVWELGLFVPPDPGPSRDPRPGRHGEVLVSGGYSLQAPAGMLGVSVQEIVQAFG